MARRLLPFYGWILVTVMAFSATLIYGVRHSFSVFFSNILGEFGWSRGSVSIMFSLNIFAYGLFAPVAGTLINRWRPRRLILVGLTTLILATAGCALARELWQFYILFGLLAPLGSAFSGWPMLAPTLTNWFVKRRGLVIGMGQAGGGFSFVYCIFIEWIISQLGWRMAFVVLAGILMIVVWPLVFLFFHFKPEEKGLKPYGATELLLQGDSFKAEKASGNLEIRNRSLREILRTSQLWLLVISYGLYWGIGCYLVLAHQVKFAEDVGYSPLFSASIFGLFGVALLSGQLSGFVSDWIGREYAGTIASSLAVMSLWALLSVRDTEHSWLLYVYAIGFGYGIGLVSPVMFASAVDIFHDKHFGAVAGLLLTGMGVGGAIGPWLGGYLYDLTGSYRIAFLTCMGCISVACLLLWLAAPRKAARRAVRP
jgi:sugar phosphate permease